MYDSSTKIESNARKIWFRLGFGFSVIQWHHYSAAPIGARTYTNTSSNILANRKEFVRENKMFHQENCFRNLTSITSTVSWKYKILRHFRDNLLFEHDADFLYRFAAQITNKSKDLMKNNTPKLSKLQSLTFSRLYVGRPMRVIYVSLLAFHFLIMKCYWTKEAIGWLYFFTCCLSFTLFLTLTWL